MSVFCISIDPKDMTPEQEKEAWDALNQLYPGASTVIVSDNPIPLKTPIINLRPAPQ